MGNREYSKIPCQSFSCAGFGSVLWYPYHIPAEIPGTCIKCQRCVRFCPQQAKYFSDKAFLSHVAMLEQNFREQSKNAVFL